MVATLTGGTAAAGVVAYRDSQDDMLFRYLPTNIDTVLGRSLNDFTVSYWGIGKPYVIEEEGETISTVGAAVRGRAVMDISAAQRASLTASIMKAYGVSTPKLVPMLLTDVEVQPVVGVNALSLGSGSKVKFPRRITIGEPFDFELSSGNSLFASFVGLQGVEDGIRLNPAFGVVLQGTSTFEGLPWEVDCTTDLASFWRYLRTSVASDVKWGWSEIPLVSFQTMLDGAVASNLLQLQFFRGSMDCRSYGRPVLEMGKEICLAVNNLGFAGQGLFSFKRKKNPTPSNLPTCGLSWPWAVYLNCAYAADALPSSPATVFERHITYTGLQTLPVASSMVLAVECNTATAGLFHDLGDPTVPCITPAKVSIMQQRLIDERSFKEALITELHERWVMGDIDDKRFYKQMNKLYRT